MYETLTGKIKTTLAKVTEVKDYFSVPKTKLTKFPCVFFKPVGFTNTFETQSENKAIYRYLMVVIVGAIKQTTMAEVFDNVLPHTVDAIIAQFNEDWNQGTTGGHRVTVKIDSADAWEVSEEQDGQVAYAPLNVEFRLLTNN